MCLITMNKLVKPPILIYNFRRKLFQKQNIRCLNHQKSTDNHVFNVQSIGIKSSLKKTLKFESFVHRSFFGELDPDYLKFPNLIASEDESHLLEEQRKFVLENFLQISDKNQHLKNFGFFDLNHLSEVEKTYLFEAIGSTLEYKSIDDKNVEKQLIVLNKLNVTNSFLSCYKEKKKLVKTILPLIVHNSMVLNTIQSSTNPNIREKCLPDFKNLRIAFAFDEPNDSFQTAPYPFWNSTASFDEETKTWKLQGNKSRLLDEDYDYYMVFCKIINNEAKKNETTFGIGSFLISPDQLKIENDGTDNYGTKYQKIEFNGLNLNDEISRIIVDYNATLLLNLRSSGQLLTSAVTLGILKQLHNNLINSIKMKDFPYKNLMEHHLTEMTELIYSLESILYLTSSHYDTFELDQIDLYLQALIVQITAAEYSEKMMNLIRFLFESKSVESIMSSEISNLLCVLNNHLDSIHSNRLLLASYGLRTIGKWKFDHVVKMRLRQIYELHYFKYLTKRYKKKINLRFEGAMDGLQALDKLNPALKKCSEKLKEALDLESNIGTHILNNYGRGCVKYQIDMNRFASIIISVFQMVSVLSRTNNSLNQKQPFSSQELILCENFFKKELINIKTMCELIEGIVSVAEEKRSKIIHTSNLRSDGYFAKPTFDRVI